MVEARQWPGWRHAGRADLKLVATLCPSQDVGPDQFKSAADSDQRGPRFHAVQITLINAPLFHVTFAAQVHGVGSHQSTLQHVAHTDGIDPGNGSNFTITESSISDGDDNVAIGASNTATANAHHLQHYFAAAKEFPSGAHATGVSNVRVSNLAISG